MMLRVDSLAVWGLGCAPLHEPASEGEKLMASVMLECYDFYSYKSMH